MAPDAAGRPATRRTYHVDPRGSCVCGGWSRIIRCLDARVGGTRQTIPTRISSRLTFKISPRMNKLLQFMIVALVAAALGCEKASEKVARISKSGDPEIGRNAIQY